MKKEKKRDVPAASLSACLLSALVMVVVALELTLFTTFFPYPCIKLLILLIVQPLGINLLLLIPMENKILPPAEPPAPAPLDPIPEDCTEKERKKAVKKQKKQQNRYKNQVKLHAARDRLRRGFLAHRITVVSLLCAGFVVCMNYFFTRSVKGIIQHSITLAVPLVLASAFFIFLVLDIWCRHEKRDYESSPCRYVRILENLHSVIKIAKFLFLAAAIIGAMPLLELWNLHMPYFYFLCVLFIAQTVAIAFFYAVRAVKQELNDNPDIRFCVSGRKKGDLDVIRYLEENTGITMRSLWSISLIKKTAPTAVLLGLAILWLSSGIVQIEPSQNGALYRLGKLQEESLEPGIHLTLPWPIDQVDVYDTKSLKEITIGYVSEEGAVGDNLWTEYHGGEENKLLLGGGNELVSINLRIEYRVDNLTDYLRSSDCPEALMESAAYEAITAKTISTNLETLLDVDRMAFAKSFEEDLVQRISRYDTGLEIVDVIMESIHPPVEVAEIYQKIISAGIDAEKILLDAQARAAVAVEKAYTAYDNNVNEAKAASYGSIADAKYAVAEFMASLEADKALGGNYRYYKYLDALQRAYSGAKLIIVGDGIDSNSLYLGKLPVS